MTQFITTLGPFGLFCMGIAIGALLVAFLLIAEQRYHQRQARARRRTRREQRQQWLNSLLDEEP